MSTFRSATHGRNLVEPADLENVRLAEFLIAVREAVPTVTFYRHKSYSVYVAYRGDPLTVGRLSFENPTNAGTGERKYCVWTDGITNNKYSEWRDEHHMAASSSLVTSVRTAARHLSRPRDMEVVRWVFDLSLPKIAAHYADAVNRWREGFTDTFLGGHRVYTISTPGDAYKLPHVPELVRHYQNGSIGDDAFAAKIGEVLNMEKDLMSLHTENAEWHVVVIRNNARGEPRVVTVKMLVSGPPSEWGNSFNIADEAYVMEVHEVPDDIKGKTAVLDMVDFGHYVEGVGVRMSEGCFYINTTQPPSL